MRVVVKQETISLSEVVWWLVISLTVVIMWICDGFYADVWLCDMVFSLFVNMLLFEVFFCGNIIDYFGYRGVFTQQGRESIV